MLMRPVLAVGIVLASLGGTASAAEDDLYRAVATVTGEGEVERARGFGLCLESVLMKVSGDPQVRTDPRIDTMKAHAADLVLRFDYWDRMSGIPVHDEQGTRERPFNLTVTFDEQKIDTALHSLGRTPWPTPRPRLAVLLGVHDATATYVLAEDGDRGRGQRESLAAEASRRGIPALLPSAALLAADHITYEELNGLGPPRRDTIARKMGADTVLDGELIWSDAAPGWIASWHLVSQEKDYRWRIDGVSFDDAFRNGLDGAAAILSGHAASWPAQAR
jgi:uncharacterized protein